MPSATPTTPPAFCLPSAGALRGWLHLALVGPGLALLGPQFRILGLGLRTCPTATSNPSTPQLTQLSFTPTSGFYGYFLFINLATNPSCFIYQIRPTHLLFVAQADHQPYSEEVERQPHQLKTAKFLKQRHFCLRLIHTAAENKAQQ